MKDGELGLQHFEMAKAIILDPDQNLIGERENNGRNLSVAVVETADLTLLRTNNQDVRESVFDALTTYLEEYPEEFAHHLQITSSVFGYSGLYDIQMEDVSDFWSDLPDILEGDTTYQPPGLAAKFDKSSWYNQKTRWLRYAAQLVLTGKKPLMIADVCCMGLDYDPKNNDLTNKSLQGKVTKR